MSLHSFLEFAHSNSPSENLRIKAESFEDVEYENVNNEVKDD